MWNIHTCIKLKIIKNKTCYFFIWRNAWKMDLVRLLQNLDDFVKTKQNIVCLDISSATLTKSWIIECHETGFNLTTCIFLTHQLHVICWKFAWLIEHKKTIARLQCVDFFNKKALGLLFYSSTFNLFCVSKNLLIFFSDLVLKIKIKNMGRHRESIRQFLFEALSSSVNQHHCYVCSNYHVKNHTFIPIESEVLLWFKNKR